MMSAESQTGPKFFFAGPLIGIVKVETAIVEEYYAKAVFFVLTSFLYHPDAAAEKGSAYEVGKARFGS